VTTGFTASLPCCHRCYLCYQPSAPECFSH